MITMLMLLCHLLYHRVKGEGNTTVSHILDTAEILAQRDPSNALGVAAAQYEQTTFDAVVQHPDHDGRTISSVVIAGMGGSALAADLAKTWLGPQLKMPFEIVKNYDLPVYVNESTLVIASSYSGNTEETVSSLQQAKAAGAQVGIICSGGILHEQAEAHGIAAVYLPTGFQPRMGVLYNLRALIALLETFGVIENKNVEIAATADWLHEESKAWIGDVPSADNYAKQLALHAVGKTPVFYGSPITAPVAYKWKISLNEDAKNVAFWNQYPEFNHNEFLGWDSHPIEKPFAVFDIKSSFDHPQVTKRFALSDRLLSGKRPAAVAIDLKGETILHQLLWGSILADFVAVYVAILNNVDPTPVALIEALKKELV